MPRLRQLEHDLWVVDAPQRFFGFPIGTRMTVVRLPSGELWTCSPVPIDDALEAELRGLGRIAHVVAPNRYHHLYVAPMLERFAGAALHHAPGLDAKRPDLPPGTTLRDVAPDAWGGALAVRHLAGVPTFEEVAFLHRPSRTLVLTDHLFHLDATCPVMARALGVALGVRRSPGFPLDARLFFVRDRAALRDSIDAVLGWDFERIVLAHGAIVEADGPAVLERAYRFLGDSSAESRSRCE